MKKIFSTLAVTALAGGVMGGAHAQTYTYEMDGVNSAKQLLYVADLDQSRVTFAPAYTYNYVVTLDKVLAPNVNVNSFTFNFDPSLPVSFVPGLTTAGYSEVSLTPGVFQFATTTGLVNAGDQATFAFYSPDPPMGSVSTASTSPAIAGGGTTTIGPGVCNCPTVPEPASLALLGLGALPMAFVARRRMSSK